MSEDSVALQAGLCLQAYAEKGVKEMYPWQAAALEGGLDGSNLVYCAPTSGGKSLVAEILMLRRLLATRKPHARFKRRKMQVHVRATHVVSSHGYRHV